MSEAQKIREKYQNLMDKHIKQLQDSCSHPDVTDWIEYYWAPAHGTGTYYKYCIRCDKIMHEKTYCNQFFGQSICGKEIVDNEIFHPLELMESGKYSREDFIVPVILNGEPHKSFIAQSSICKQCFDNILKMSKESTSK